MMRWLRLVTAIAVALPCAAQQPSPDSGAKAAAPDSAPQTGQPKPPTRAVASPRPTLRGVCTDSTTSASGLATDVLMVTFRPDATAGARTEAIKSVGGTVLLLPAAGADQPSYVRVPSGGNEYRLQRLADQLIRQPPVWSVSPARCRARAVPTVPVDSAKPR